MSATEKLVVKKGQSLRAVISYVENATSTKTRDIRVEQVFEAIRTGGKELKGQITQIRNRYEAELAITGDREKAKRAIDGLKKRLPGVLWSGQFSERANARLLKHSGLVCADLDFLGERLPEIRKKLQASPYVFALYLSPTGDGLKPVVRVPADAAEHAGSFRAIKRYVSELTGIEIDEKCKDPARLCFMSYDPDLYVNENSREIEPVPEPLRLKPKRKNNGVINPNKRQRIAVDLLRAADWPSATS